MNPLVSDNDWGCFVIGDDEIPINTNKINIQEFLVKKQIPYLNVSLEITPNGKKLNPNDRHSGWESWGFKKCNTHRLSNQYGRHNTHLTYLKGSGFGVIDIDIDPNKYPEKLQEYTNLYLEKYGGFATTSTRGKKHLWFKVHQNDPCVNKAGWVKTEYGNIDLCYNTLFEPMTENNVIDVSKLKYFIDFPKKEPKSNESLNHTIKSSKLDDEKSAILNLIDKKHLQDRDSWYRIMIGLNTETNDIDLCDSVSQRAGNYQGKEDVINTIDSFKESNCSWGTIEYYAKKSNEQAYMEIKSRYFSDECDSVSDNDVAEKFIEIMGDSMIMDMNDTIYLWDKNTGFWISKSVEKHILIELLNVFKPMIVNKLKKYKGKSPKELKDDTDYKKWNAFYTKITGNKTKLAIVNEIITLMIQYKKEYKFDLLRPELICFTNCVFDLDKRKIVKLSKYDYITMNTGYKWVQPTEKQIETITFLLNDIQPEEEIYKCMISVIRKGFYGSLLEKFVIWEGRGRNGKGLIHELLAETLGNYFYEGTPLTFSEKQKSGSNPELASISLKRLIITSEPSNEGRLQIDTIKRLTGNQRLNARFNHSNDCVVWNTGTYIIEENEMPEFTKGGNSNAMQERIIKIPFKKQFTSFKEKIKAQPDIFFEINESYKEESFKLEHRCALFWVILMSPINELYIPDCIKEETSELMRDNDPIYNFIMSNYTILNEMTEENKQKYINDKNIPHKTLTQVISKYKETYGKKVNVKSVKQQIMENQELIKLGIVSNSKPNTTQNNTPCLIWIQEKDYSEDNSLVL
tara:strand:- start:57 stop:2456 length:2400 start_codon:yes stop_codon:yes gene_type:complete